VRFAFERTILHFMQAKMKNILFYVFFQNYILIIKPYALLFRCLHRYYPNFNWDLWIDQLQSVALSEI
jgi:hypothetical protein